eukprot:CAMPEP_0173364038 /NCGR_PEP_ID=MMETSP1144-20121109/22740_1 /TAXON_ID=483371 /ORGANISM="non described non described, Strain CCMP2298" /LENGTH=63 /DNA_ID=CAMNT_0014314097 /DNA_START=201 /DNA_END=392 /DNA_ORIENTATION=+
MAGQQLRGRVHPHRLSGQVHELPLAVLVQHSVAATRRVVGVHAPPVGASVLALVASKASTRPA